jgi:hypothetical protein
VTEVEKLSSEGTRASIEGEMLSIFSSVRPGCESEPRYSPRIAIGAQRCST